MQTIYVSPEFPLNRRMRKAVKRGKLQVVREHGENLSLGGKVSFETGRRIRTASSPLVCMADGGGEVGGGSERGKYTESEYGGKIPVCDFIKKAYDAMVSFCTEDDSGVGKGNLLIWRGLSDARHQLIPSAFRDAGSVTCMESKKRRENSMAIDFIRRARARQNNLPMDEEHLKWLCHMQHNGLPTRLMDWSESPLVALFFAVDEEGCPQCGQEKDGAVWALEAGRLNELQCKGYGIAHPEDKDVKDMAKNAIHGIPQINSGNVFSIGTLQMGMQHVLQQSWFTIHGNNTPLEDVYGEQVPDCKRCLIRIRIPGEEKREIRKELGFLGLQKHHLFAGLEHLANHIGKRSYYLGR